MPLVSGFSCSWFMIRLHLPCMKGTISTKLKFQYFVDLSSSSFAFCMRVQLSWLDVAKLSERAWKLRMWSRPEVTMMMMTIDNLSFLPYVLLFLSFVPAPRERDYRVLSINQPFPDRELLRVAGHVALWPQEKPLNNVACCLLCSAARDVRTYRFRGQF